MPDPTPAPAPTPQENKANLATHPLVTKLMGNSDTPPDLVALTGYFGPSKKPDSIRLYPTLDFHSYCEIPRAAVVATSPVDPKDDQSATMVHVKAGTPVEVVQTSTQPVESYLQGGITGQYLGSSAGQAQSFAAVGTAATLCTRIGCGVTHPPCSGVHTQCCPISHPPCSGVHTQCCPITHPPCSGVQTQCCPVQGTAATV